ncbi:MAG: AbrB family transcriptional regulator, partial [Bacteroidota bacterium]
MEYLSSHPLISIFIVAAIGYIVGKISYKGSSLGVAAVLFVGLIFGGLAPDIELPEILLQLGLVFYLYSIGLMSGDAFFNSFKKDSIRNVIFVIVMLSISALIAYGIHYLFNFNAASTVGIYSGSSTNTAALAAVIDQINQGSKITDKASLIQNGVVAYSYTYPIGVIASMIAIVVMEKIFKIKYKEEAASLSKDFPIDQSISNIGIKITNPKVANTSLRDLFQEYEWDVVFGRHFQKEKVELIHFDSKFELDDEITVVGSAEELEKVVHILGEKTTNLLSYDRREFDVRRIFVSNPKIVGIKLSSLNLSEKYSAVMTRIRRGDVDILAKGDTILQLGDRIRFVARRKDLNAISELFGDSYYRSSQVNLFSFGLGIALGLLIGSIKFSLPGDIEFQLGFAGGPLIIALILGYLKRTGPIVWTLPYSTNITLQQIGLILFMAVVGLRSGGTFFASLQGGEGYMIFIAGIILSILTAFLTLWIGFKFLKIPFTVLMGYVANQPAILEFAMNKSKNRAPLIGYSFVLPI